MGQADKIYDGIIQEILLNGVWDKDQKVRTKWADGTPAHTKSIITAQMKFDNSEVAILTKKKVAWKTAIKEILTFWQQKEFTEEAFHKQNIHIWDEWIIKEPGRWQGTIGPSYGYQMGKKVRSTKRIFQLGEHDDIEYWDNLDQVDYLLKELKENPSSRRHVTSLWNINDLDEMALNPCVWNTQWLVKEGKLHLVVGVRSNDMALGNPFNVFQYQVLQRMIAQVTGYELGTLTFNINDAHVYERHIEGLQEQLEREDYPAPTLWINPDVKDFYDFTIDDFKLIDYQHGDPIKFEVAI
jgi:thymidylate synthase